MPPSSLPEITVGLLSILAKGAVVLSLAAGIVWLLRNRSAAQRHAVWAVSLGMILLLPLVEGTLPGWEVSSSEAMSETSFEVVSTESGPQSSSPEDRPVSPESRDRASEPEASTRPEEASQRGRSPLFFETAKWRTLMQAFLGIWALGVAIVLGGTLIGLLRSYRRARRAVPLDQGEWDRPLEWARSQLGTDRSVRLYCSAEVSVPMTFGGFRPTILLPASARQWSRARRRAVLLHEIAHVHRGDFFANLIAQLACALHWVNPLVWQAARRLRAERERACDNSVLRAGVRLTEYADHLVSVAREASGLSALGGALAMAKPSELKRRVQSLLSGGIPTNPISRMRMALLAVPLLVTTSILGAVQPAASGSAGAGAAPEKVHQAATDFSEHIPADTTSCDPASTALNPPYQGNGQLKATCQQRTYRLAPTDTVALRGRYGRVRVEAWDSSAAVLEATIVPRKSAAAEADSALSRIHVRPAGDTIRAEGPADDAPGWWSVGYRLRVPAQTALSVTTYSGDVQVRGINGGFNLTSEHGDLTAYLAPDIGARLRAKTDYGEIEVGFPVSMQGPITEEIQTTLGNGGPLIQLASGADITVRRAN